MVACLECGSNSLREYKEKNITEYRNLNKDGRISKRKVEGIPDYNNPWGIECVDCGALYDYETDSKDRIVNLTPKK